MYRIAVVNGIKYDYDTEDGNIIICTSNINKTDDSFQKDERNRYIKQCSRDQITDLYECEILAVYNTNNKISTNRFGIYAIRKNNIELNYHHTSPLINIPGWTNYGSDHSGTTLGIELNYSELDGAVLVCKYCRKDGRAYHNNPLIVEEAINSMDIYKIYTELETL